MTQSSQFPAVRRVTVASILAGILLLLVAGSASAAWQTGAQLASGSLSAGSPFQATTPVVSTTISKSGKYEFFVTRSSGLGTANGGIFRKDLTNDAAPLDVVAAQPTVTNANCGIPVGQGSFISVSADGRYVAFSTSEDGLVAGDNNGRRDVYVRDMNTAIGSAGAFELASAADASTTAPSYALTDLGGGNQIPVPATDDCMYGSELPGPNSISNDGKRVLFTNTAFTSVSSASGTNTAPGNIWARTTGAAQTELVTKVAYSYDWNLPSLPNPTVTVGGALPDQEYFDSDPQAMARTRPQATISGDGSAVAWVGAFARYQTKYHGSENSTLATGDYQSQTFLYRRIADGAQATTRRPYTWADLDDQNCDPALNVDFLADADPSSSATYQKKLACLGPFANETLQYEAHAPRLTDDGRRVFALVGLPGHNLASYLSSYPADLVVSDMTPGVSRKAGTKWLTRATNNTDTPIDDFSITGDGKRAVVLTSRRTFSSTGLVQSGTFPSSGLGAAVFAIDGSQGSVSGESGWSGAPIEWIARPTAGTTDATNAIYLLPGLSLDGTGHRLAFGSKDSGFYSGANGQMQALCVTDVGSSCQTAPAAAAPVVSIGAPAASTGYGGPISASYSAVGATSVTCQWDSEAVLSPCPASPLAAKSLAAGAHTFTVTGTNATGSTAVISNFTVGAAPAAATITSPSEGTGVSSPVTPTYTVSGSPDRVRCWYDNTTWVVTSNGNSSTPGNFNCPASLPARTLATGTHTFNVTTSNAFGSTTTTRNFTVGTPTPGITISNPLDNGVYANTISANFVVTGSPTSVQCKIDNGSYSACVSPKSLGTLTAGNGTQHTFSVQATNTGGTSTVTKTFTVVSNAPTVAITSPADGAAGVASPVSPAFTIGGGAAASVSCQWDSEPEITSCTPAQVVNKGLSTGSHTFKVTATNPIGSASVTNTFTIVEPPTVAVNTPTENQTLGSPVSASFTLGGGAATSVSCQWDAESVISSCASPQGPKSLTAGSHTFKVTAANAAGSASVTRNFTVVAPPVVTINTPANGAPSVTSPVSPTFTLSGGVASTVTCRWDSETPITPCSQAGVAGKVLTAGEHTFKVTATNLAGSDEKTTTFTVPTPPSVAINAPTENEVVGSPVNATFTLGGSAAGSVTCQWDSEPAISSCTSPLAPKTLAAGAHTLTVTASGAGGSASVTRHFTVLAAPTVTITAPASGATVLSPVNGGFTLGGGAPASVTCQWDSEAAIGSCTPASLAGKVFSPGAHTLKVTATNAVGQGESTSAFTVKAPDVITPPPPNPPSIEPGKGTVKAANATIPLTVTGSGSVSAKGTAKLPKGKKLVTQAAGSGSATVAGDGTVTLTFKLNAAAKKYLKKKKKLAVTVAITYSPNGGTPIKKTVKLTFKSK